MIRLSYSTLNDLIIEPHTWMCKQMGLKRKSFPWFQEGKDAHRIIQSHVCGKKTDPRLSHIAVSFPIVEDVDFDEKTHFSFDFNTEYSVHGYLDGINPHTGSFLEIKTSSKPWSLGKFNALMQWRVYALSNPDFKEVYFITCTRDVRDVKLFSMSITEESRKLAKDWIQKGIDIIEKGDFSYKGLGPSRQCNYIDCPFCGSK